MILSILEKLQAKINRLGFFSFISFAILITGNLSFALGDYNHDFDILYNIRTDDEEYCKERDEILSHVCDKKSADIAAQKITELRQRPEYKNLLLFPDIGGDASLRAKLENAQLWGSIDLARVLYGCSYYLFKEEKITEEASRELAEHLFSEMGNITSGGPGFTRDTAWIANEFKDNLPFIDGLPFDPTCLLPEAPQTDGLPFLPEPISANFFTEEYKDGQYFREYQFYIIFQSKKHLVSQWYVAPAKSGVYSESSLSPDDLLYSLLFIILIVFNIIYFVLNAIMIKKTKCLCLQRPANNADLCKVRHSIKRRARYNGA